MKSEQQVVERSHHLFNLSARSEAGVRQAALKLSQHLDQEPNQSLPNLAYTMHVGRKQFDHRLNLVASSKEDLQELCRQAAEQPWEHGMVIGGASYRQRVGKQAPKLAFLFTGQGNQYTGMGQELYESSSVFKEAVDMCVAILDPYYPVPFLQYMFNPMYADELDMIYIATPAMFVLEYAVAKLWMSWGIKPDIVMGHSFGEYVAATICGAMTPEEAIPLLVERGRLMHEEMEEGGMVSVLCERDVLQIYLDNYREHLSIATQNSPQSFVISGRVAAIEDLITHLEANNIVHKRLPISVAGHSPLMDPILAPFKEHIEQNIKFKPLSIPLVSNLTAEVMENVVLDAQYWGRHMREPVLFSQGVEFLLKQGVTAFVEVGPHPVLKTMVDTMTDGTPLVVGSLNRKESPWKAILISLGQLAAAGVNVDWHAFDADYRRRRVHAPTYPFERKSYWISFDTPALQLAPDASAFQEVAATAQVEEKVQRSTRPTLDLLEQFWKEVLGISKVEPDDHFLTLGGDSLMMIQIKSRVQKALGIDIPIKDVFLHPTFSDFVAHVDSLRQEAADDEEAEIKPAEVKEVYPLSHTQRRLWFLYKFQPESPVYNMPSHYLLKGQVNVEWLEQALQFMVDRHSAFRTVFTEIDGKPYQVVRPEWKFQLVYFDGTGLNTREEQMRYGEQRVIEDQNIPFNLTEGPLLRAMLFKLSDDEFHFYINQAHIITDGWSLDLFRKELLEAYHAIANNQAPAMKKAVQYIDYVEWYEAEQANGRWAKEETFWLQTLAKPLPVLNLPTDFPRPEIQTYNGALGRLNLTDELATSLRTFAQREGVSMYMLLISAFKMLLHHLSGEDDLLVGTPVMGRTVEALESTMGFFANSVVIRTRMNSVETLRDLLKQVTGQSFDAFEHQSYPFDKLVDQVNVERDMSRSPIFTTFFSYRYVTEGKEAEDQLIRFTAPGEESRGLGHNVSKFDLSCIVNGKDDEMTVLFEYNTDLFRAETIDRFLDGYRQVLEAYVADANQSVRELNLLTVEEQTLYDALNDTTADFPSEQTIPALFYAQAAKHADAPALSDPEQTLTYRELNERSNRIAHELRTRGIGKNSIVGVLMERSVDAVIAILGVLKSGAAYVPIDPSYPESRVRFMMEDSAAALLLTHEATVAALDLQGSDKTLCLEHLASDLPTADLDLNTEPHDLAYMIYTSGSTGTPKGTELHHVGVANLTQWKRDRYAYSTQDIILQFASFSFDASVWEMFPALLNGAHVYLLGEEERTSVEGFTAAVERMKATTVTLPTVFFNQLSRHLSDDDLRKFETLQRIFVAGEALQGEVVRAWQRRFGERILIVNAYGPTESTVCATVYEIDHRVSDEQVHIPIGTPIANTRIYILGANLKPCPVNAVGELHIESVGLARGYRNQAERTEQAFIPHPFSEEPGAVLYKSGDLARLLPDGTIEFIGRRDDQVKIRGHRIEIGEIEESLLRHPSVKNGAVVAPKLPSGGHQLIAYVTAHAEAQASGDSLDTSSVRAFLAKHLPDYMVPSHFVALDEMPLTPNGKIDRKKLLSLDIEVEAVGYVPPQDELQAKLAYAWEKCLYREQVGIHDNFFSVGGDSIISMQVVSVLNREGLRVKTQDLFKHQTIAELADHIETNDLYLREDHAQEVSVSGVVPLGPIQQHLFELENTDREYYLLALILDIRKPVVSEHVQGALDLLLEHHDMLRATYSFENGEVIQTILPKEEAKLQLEVHEFPEMDMEGVFAECTRLEAELKASIKFADGLVVKAALLNFGKRQARLIFIIHHLVTDMVSSRILTTDLISLYEHLEQGKEAKLPQKSSTYDAWVRSTTKHMNGPEGERAFSYWKPFLDVAGEVALPVDVPNGPNRMMDNTELFVSIDEDATTKLLTEVTERYSTSIKEVLLTTMLRSVAKWTGQEWVGLATEGHGRDEIAEDDDINLERTVGWFTSVYPFYARIDENQPVRESISQVVENLGNLPHGGASFNMLRYLSEEQSVRELFSNFRMPEVCYNFFGQYDNMRSLTLDWSPGVQFVENHPSDSENHFDLLIRGRIRDGKLSMGFQFSKERYHEATIQGLMQLFEAEIRHIVQAHI
ncbi:amino acid adenylation domain-containing protein [Tumebacillus sp. ITR2]|uniref:Amino acid adenylation domain-containing protein n=1 Tax=Tumebacillus amylolyticus TaxID=2801339 RepID=A0ABS1JAM5_9BACL|nr:non-ribosomal peptide synthetase [Tumebacillus amylolyticus]MBL0387094.1 amino acid adenylation domain-containing protein [Tumebacillus amylolyticus]